MQNLLKTFILFLLTSQIISAQSIKKIYKEITSIDSIQQITSFKSNHLDWNIQMIQFDESDTILLKELVDLTLGSTTTIKQDKEVYVFKIIIESTIKEYRVSYIYLSGKDLTVNQMDSIQKVITKKYHEGVPFEELARTYSMDGKAENGGDLGWISEDLMVEEFADAVVSQGENDIFTVEIPSQQWYYIVLKTYPDRQRIKKVILKIKSRASKS